MSRRMALAARLSRLILRRYLAGATPEGLAGFDGAENPFQRPPRHARHLVRHRNGIELHWVGVGATPPDRVILYLHGGAFVAGSPRGHGPMLARLAKLTGVEVCAPRYRLLQQALFPAAFDDAVTAWGALREIGYRPGQIMLAGDSAGGCLAFALLSHVLAAGERPAGLVAFSPWTDLSLSGESLGIFGPGDPVLPIERIAELCARYLDGADPRDPRASPLFAAFPDPPPVLIQCGAEEALLSDSLRMGEALRSAGGKVAVDLWPGCLHAWQVADGWLPESRQALRQAAAFVQDSLASASR